MSEKPKIGLYETGADVMRLTMRDSFGLALPDSLYHRWRGLFKVLRHVDFKLDSEKDIHKRKTFETEIIEFLQQKRHLCFGDEDWSGELTTLRGDLTELGHTDDFLRHLKMIFKVGDRLRSTENPDEYAQLTRLEGQITSKLFADFIPDDTSCNQAILKFNRWFSRLSRLGNVIDSIIDLPEDSRLGEVRVKPDFKTRFALSNAALKDVPATWSHTPTSILGYIPLYLINLAKNTPTVLLKKASNAMDYRSGLEKQGYI